MSADPLDPFVGREEQDPDLVAQAWEDYRLAKLEADEAAQQDREWARMEREAATAPAAPQPTQARSSNELRPARFRDVIGQDRAKALLSRIVEATLIKRESLDHMLLVGPSGTGKTTFAHIIGNEMGVDVYQIEAPVSLDTLLQLRDVMMDGDILLLDEVHQQAIAERRGKSSATQPEVLFSLMEDRTIPTQHGLLAYPKITLIGATTDEGLLPDAFVNRFPLRPTLAPYSTRELAQIARSNARALDVKLSPQAALAFARASRGVPRQINNYVRNGAMLSSSGIVNIADAREVVRDLNATTDDGLTADMKGMLVFLYKRGKRTNAAGDVTYQASVGTIATGIGKSRDVKAVQLRIEPYLIERGYVQVTHGGRVLTDEGIQRAQELAA